jgi:hypothetical protein
MITCYASQTTTYNEKESAERKCKKFIKNNRDGKTVENEIENTNRLISEIGLLKMYSKKNSGEIKNYESRIRTLKHYVELLVLERNNIEKGGKA